MTLLEALDMFEVKAAEHKAAVLLFSRTDATDDERAGVKIMAFTRHLELTAELLKLLTDIQKLMGWPE